MSSASPEPTSPRSISLINLSQNAKPTQEFQNLVRNDIKSLSSNGMLHIDEKDFNKDNNNSGTLLVIVMMLTVCISSERRR